MNLKSRNFFSGSPGIIKVVSFERLVICTNGDFPNKDKYESENGPNV